MTGQYDLYWELDNAKCGLCGNKAEIVRTKESGFWISHRLLCSFYCHKCARLLASIRKVELYDMI